MAKHRRMPGDDPLNREEAADTPAYWSVDDSRWPTLRPDLPADVAGLLAPPIVVGVARVAPTSRLTPPGASAPAGGAAPARRALPAPAPRGAAGPSGPAPAPRGAAGPSAPMPAPRGPAGAAVPTGRHRRSAEHPG